MNNINQLRKSLDKKVFGVAGGIADHFNVDPIIVRLAFIVLALTFDFVILLYLALALIMPESRMQEDDDLEEAIVM